MECCYQVYHISTRHFSCCNSLLQTSEPNEDGKECNPLDQVGSSLSTLLLGAAFTLVAVCFTTIRTATQGDSLLGGVQNDTVTHPRFVLYLPLTGPFYLMKENKLLISQVTEEEAKELEDDEAEEVTYNYTFFHFTFLTGTMFIFMLVTDWATVSGSSGDTYVPLSAFL